mmetsp:Transcript_21829/g.30365  ORF Transcript_21829/g.30365 Transcript_21829/m.30365 type:complete len:158 (+) Transcript_21829:79-552(+)|eukprot:CAMPEP_0196580348 /NCGR_PEP_ID=MMETSP1081-20130531/28575_1 /TAXON_ID=36882 /ORGANISM="Pyramimonas amylifera, Strain CCMP720" /LENGTH=157 /DNA_ID=CAMNT_0041900195 /DNA_START=78 /DNA_END=551 /DNA_ORIENTATION=+
MSDGIELVAPKMKLHQFTENLAGSTLHFQIYYMLDQIFIWAGSGGIRLDDLQVAMQTRHSEQMPLVSTLFGDVSGASDSAAMAQRISKRTGKHIVLSCSLPPDSHLMQAVVEKRLVQVITSEDNVRPNGELSVDKTSDQNTSSMGENTVQDSNLADH